MRDSKRRLNRFELFEVMHLLALVGGVVLTAGVALTLRHMGLDKIIFHIPAPYDQEYLARHKTKQTNNFFKVKTIK
jgi:hypothetical protein